MLLSGLVFRTVAGTKRIHFDISKLRPVFCNNITNETNKLYLEKKARQAVTESTVLCVAATMILWESCLTLLRPVLHCETNGYADVEYCLLSPLLFAFEHNLPLIN